MMLAPYLPLNYPVDDRRVDYDPRELIKIQGSRYCIRCDAHVGAAHVWSMEKSGKTAALVVALAAFDRFESRNDVVVALGPELHKFGEDQLFGRHYTQIIRVVIGKLMGDDVPPAVLRGIARGALHHLNCIRFSCPALRRGEECVDVTHTPGYESTFNRTA